MPRILKRPMFNRGGSSNQGIMDGLVDRTGLAEGTPKFDTGKMKEDASSILSKIAGLTPGGMMGKAAAGIASMTKGNEAEIVKAVQKMLAVTPMGQIPAAIKFLADRYRIDPAIVERITKNQMTDPNQGFGPQGPDGTPDEGYNPNIGIDSGAEDYYNLPDNTNRLDKYNEQAGIDINDPDIRRQLENLERKPIPLPGPIRPENFDDMYYPEGPGNFPKRLPGPIGEGDGRTMEERFPGQKYNRDLNFFDFERGPFRPGDGGDFEYLNQGGRVGFNEGTPLFDKETTAAQVKAITEAQNEFSPLPETRLPIGQLGSDLMRGLGFRDSAANAYDSFVTADDKRRAAMAGRTSSAVSTSLGQQIAERNAKLKAMGSSNMQKDYTNLRQFETAVDNRIKQRREIKSYDDVPVDLAYIRGASEYDVDVSRNLRTTQNPQGQEINQLKRGFVPYDEKTGEFKYMDMDAGYYYYDPQKRVFVQKVPTTENENGETVRGAFYAYDKFTFQKRKLADLPE